LSLFLLAGQLAPVSSEDNCIQEEDAGLIYDPNELPICPPPMSELVPSTVGRPPTWMPHFLARCAGMMDAISIVMPEVLNHPEFVVGDEFFAKAVAWRDKPPIGTLEEYRKEGREHWLVWIGQEINNGGSAVVHANIACLDEFESQSGH
jgi:hypothetical protein